MTNLEALADIAAAISAEGHPASAKHLRDAVGEIRRLRAAVSLEVTSNQSTPNDEARDDPRLSRSMSHRAEQGDVDCRKALATTVTPAGQRILNRHYPSDRLYKNQYDGTFRWDREGDGESKRAVEKLIEAGLLTLHPVGTGGVTSLSAAGMALVSKRVRGSQPV